MGTLIYISDDEKHRVSISIDDDATTDDFVESAVAPLMYGMGYFPTRVAAALNLEDVLSIYKNYQGEDHEYL